MCLSGNIHHGLSILSIKKLSPLPCEVVYWCDIFPLTNPIGACSLSSPTEAPAAKTLTHSIRGEGVLGLLKEKMVLAYPCQQGLLRCCL